MNRKIFCILLTLFLIVSCSPKPYVLYIDVRESPKEYHIFTEDKSVAVAAYIHGNAKKDSALIAKIPLAIAETLESEQGLAENSIPVYMTENPVDMERLEEFGGIPELLEANYLMYMDSFYIGNYMKETAVNIPDGEYNVYKISIPVVCTLKVFNTSEMKLKYIMDVSPTIVLEVYGEKDENLVSIVSRYSKEIVNSFTEIGVSVANKFLPQWSRERRVIYNIETNKKWNSAYISARNFNWSDAIKIWTELIDENKELQSANLAFNIAVGFEMLQDYEMARKWLDYAKTRNNFPNIDVMKKILDEKEILISEFK